MKPLSFNNDWQFHLGMIPDGQKFEEQPWRELELPHDWSIELPRKAGNPSGSHGGFFTHGFAWYRKLFDTPANWRGKKVGIEFEGVYMNAEVWLNDNFLGRHPYGYTSFFYDLTPYLKPDGSNELRISVDNACQKNSRWYSGSGIYRPVWLWVGDGLHIAHWGVHVTTPQISTTYASVITHTRVQNETAEEQDVVMRSYIFAPDGATLATSTSTATISPGTEHLFSQKTHLPAPRLWSPDTPDLYQVRCEIVADGKVMDGAEQTFGIRSLEVDAERGLRLNGKPIKLKGGCVHHDNGILGAASYPDSEERKVALLKASGFNAVRCAHNPPAPAFLEACDRLGMLVVDEAFDCWREGKNPYDYHVVFSEWWQRDLESMILRDRNHPSIMMWSIGNEVIERDGHSQGNETARQLASLVRSLDTTRPVTSALCGSWRGEDWEVMDKVFASLDICGYNYQWKQVQPDHARLPQRIIMGTESVAMEAFEHWMSVLDHDYHIGDFVWTALDYLGEAGIGRVHFDPAKPFMADFPWHQANCGDLDVCGFKRPQSHYRDVLWGSGGKLYIAVHDPKPDGKESFITYWGWPECGANWNWAKYAGKPIIVDVYSACDRVELYLNEHLIGSQSTGRPERFTARFEVPYQAGNLKAVGYINGQLAAETTLSTAGKAAMIRLVSEREVLKASEQTLWYVAVEVTDRKGIVQPQATQLIHFEVQGEGSLLAVGSANPTSMERYQGNQRKAYRGRCLAVVKSTGKPGEIRLRATGVGLEAAEIVIRAG